MREWLSKYFGNDEAFGLPKGTVRGLVFLLLTGTVCLLAKEGKEIPVAVVSAWTGVIGFYFGAKTNGETKEPPKA